MSVFSHMQKADFPMTQLIYADKMANSIDPDQTACLTRVNSVC